MGSLLKLLLPLLLCATAMGTVIFNRNNGYCGNLPPGVRKMSRGVDITELDMLPLDIVGESGYKSPVVKMKCTKPRYWFRNGTKYQLPDQVWTMTTTPGGLLSSDANVYRTSYDLRKEMLQTSGISGFEKYSFSNSKIFQYIENQILNSSVYFSDISAIDSESRVDLVPHWSLELDDYAEDYLNNVIKNTPYSYNPQAYHEFIEQFGTHYFAVARFGGRIRVLQRTASSYFNGYSYERNVKHARENFRRILADVLHYGSKTKRNWDLDTQYIEATTHTIKYYGGDTNLLASDGILAWQPTVEDDPWLLSGQVRPISDLIRNDVQREGVSRAIWQYVLRRFLNELERRMFSRKIQLGSRFTSLDTRLRALYATTMGGLVETEVATLRDDIERD